MEVFENVASRVEYTTKYKELEFHLVQLPHLSIWHDDVQRSVHMWVLAMGPLTEFPPTHQLPESQRAWS